MTESDSSATSGASEGPSRIVLRREGAIVGTGDDSRTKSVWVVCGEFPGGNGVKGEKEAIDAFKATSEGRKLKGTGTLVKAIPAEHWADGRFVD
jgi:hypothetical protein